MYEGRSNVVVKSSLVVIAAIFFGAAPVAFAALTLTGTSITGDTSFINLTGATSTIFDVGSGNTLSLQTTNNGPITTGSGLFTLAGTLAVTNIDRSGVISIGTSSATTITVGRSGQVVIFPGSVGIGTTTAPLFPLDVSGKIGINGIQVIYVPNQTNFVGTMYIGNGGADIDNTGSDAGDFNTYVGIGSGSSSTIAKKNTAFGYKALNAAASGWDNTAIGYNALSSGVGTGNLDISGTGIEFYANTAVGEGSMASTTTGSYNTAVGTNSLLSNLTGSWNTAVGVHALNSNATGTYNVAVGYHAAYGNTSGVGNIAIGMDALELNNTESDLIAIGRNALYTNVGGGVLNIAIGKNAAVDNASGDYLVALGHSALHKNSGGTKNLGIGFQAGYNNKTGSNNIIIGHQAGYGSDNASNYSYNVVVGYGAGGVLQTNGNLNTLIGYQTGDNITTGASNIIIGANIDAPSATGSNQLNIGNLIYGDLSTSKVGVGTSTPSTLLHLTATTTPTLRIGGPTIAGCIELLDSAGDGTVNYITASGGTLTATTTKPAACQ